MPTNEEKGRESGSRDKEERVFLKRSKNPSITLKGVGRKNKKRLGINSTRLLRE